MSFDRSNSSVKKSILKDKKACCSFKDPSVNRVFFDDKQVQDDANALRGRPLGHPTPKGTTSVQNSIRPSSQSIKETNQSTKQLPPRTIQKQHLSNQSNTNTQHLSNQPAGPFRTPKEPHSGFLRQTARVASQVSGIVKKRLQLSWAVWAQASGRAVSGVSPRLPATNPRLQTCGCECLSVCFFVSAQHVLTPWKVYWLVVVRSRIGAVTL